MSASTRTEMIARLWELLEPMIESAGFALLDLEYVRQKDWFLRLYVDKPDLPVIEGLGVAPGVGINLDQCAVLSRQISALLDVEDVIPQAYRLEVSSPGAQRPLRKKQDFERFQSCRIRVKTQDPLRSEDPNFPTPSRNILGQVVAVEDDALHIDMDGHLFCVPWRLINKAYVEPDMDEWLALASKTRQETGE